jgi:hypothetical protein
MQRPIGVTLLALGAGLVGLYEIWRALIFMGIVSFNFVGEPVSFPNPQWGQVLWALILAAIWFWIAAGFWNVRAYAWSFGNFIALFTLIWGFFAVLFGSSVEAETIPWLLAGGIFLYLNYPGVRDHFYEKEMSLLTPEQRAAMEQMQAAQAAFVQAGGSGASTAAPAPSAPPPAAPAAPAAPTTPPAAPPSAPPPSTPPNDTTPTG